MRTAKLRAFWLVPALAGRALPLAAAPDSGGDSPAPLEAGAQIAAIELVGARPGDGLEALLAELLERQDVKCAFRYGERFAPEALFEEDRGTEVRVFVVLDRATARLYLRGPGGRRFLLRTLALANGLDEVGRELIGQVVESSVLALLRSNEGLDREQATAQVSRENAVPPAVLSPSPAKSEPRRIDPPSRGDAELEFLVGTRFRAAFSGPELGAALAPGVELALGWRSAFVLRARLTGELGLPQALDAETLSARVTASSLRAGAEVGLLTGHSQTAFVGISGGVDFWSVRHASYAPEVTPAPAFSHTTGMIRPELRYEWRFENLALALAGLVDLSLVETHYDLIEPGGSRRIATPWSARPGVALSIALAL